MHAGHGMRERYVPINIISQKLGKDMSSCLPACHALTGRATTSSLYRIGKNTAFTKLKTHLSELKDQAHFGLSPCLEASLPAAREYALLLYGKKKKRKWTYLNNMYKERCTRQQYGATVTSPNHCYGVLLARDGLSAMEP